MIEPLSLAVGARVVSGAVSRVAEPLMQGGEAFFDLFKKISLKPSDPVSSEAESTIEGRGDGGSGAVLESLQQRLQELLHSFSGSFSGPLDVELSPLGSVYVAGSEFPMREAEGILDGDQEFRDLFADYVARGGDRRVAFDLRDAAESSQVP